MARNEYFKDNHKNPQSGQNQKLNKISLFYLYVKSLTCPVQTVCKQTCGRKNGWCFISFTRSIWASAPSQDAQLVPAKQPAQGLAHTRFLPRSPLFYGNRHFLSHTIDIYAQILSPLLEYKYQKCLTLCCGICSIRKDSGAEIARRTSAYNPMRWRKGA